MKKLLLLTTLFSGYLIHGADPKNIAYDITNFRHAPATVEFWTKGQYGVSPLTKLKVYDSKNRSAESIKVYGSEFTRVTAPGCVKTIKVKDENDTLIFSKDFDTKFFALAGNCNKNKQITISDVKALQGVKSLVQVQ